MSGAFRRHGDRIRAELEPFEVQLLRQLRDSVRASVEGQDPDDPAIARLFPATVSGDDEADDELRRLIRDDLVQSKLDGLDAIVDLLEDATPHRGRLRLELEPDDAMLVLGVLNDLRLALGARIRIEDIDRDELGEDDPRARTVAVMDHLGWLQEQLLEVVDPESVRHYDDGHGERT
ncbi:MAG: DUF2017 family protein [Nitriliruptorales bacterium]|nr:DUF2017 family protein [Nitriliruptorales bacterium]